MTTLLPNIPITFGSDLSREEISKIAEELVETWNWEGRQLGRIDFIRDGPRIRVYLYPPPCLQLIPLKSNATSGNGASYDKEQL